jgi:hypothetical protein
MAPACYPEPGWRHVLSRLGMGMTGACAPSASVRCVPGIGGICSRGSSPLCRSTDPARSLPITTRDPSSDTLRQVEEDTARADRANGEDPSTPHSKDNHHPTGEGETEGNRVSAVDASIASVQLSESDRPENPTP